jgi:hypothetical protein
MCCRYPCSLEKSRLQAVQWCFSELASVFAFFDGLSKGDGEEAPKA